MAKKAPQAGDSVEPESNGQVTSPVTTAPAGEAVTKIVSDVPILPDDGGSILGTVAMPEVKENAIEAARADNTASAVAPDGSQAGTPKKGETDATGRPWNPLYHEDPMRLNRDGFIALRRGGASKPKAGDPRPSLKSVAKTDGAPPSPSLDQSAKIEASATTCAGLFFIGAVTIGGEDLAPDEKAGEKETIKGYFADYFKAKGVIDIPPGIALAAGLGLYVASKWNRPTFTKRRATVWEKIGRWWNDFRWRRQNVAPSQVDNGAADVRER